MRVFILIFFSSIYLFSCTVCDTKNSNNETLVGRNFDWSQTQGQINFIPQNSNNFGIVLLTQDDIDMPYEGMNTQGLFIAISAVPHSPTFTNPLKPIRKSLEMVKIILQKASTIEEAVDIFDDYSIAFGEFLGNPLIHFKIVQKDGNSVIVEFVKSKMVVIEDKRAKIMTNHYLESEASAPNKSSFKRYNIVQNSVDKIERVEHLFALLNRVKQSDTVWSTIYNLNRQEIYIKYQEQKIVKFSLKDELYGQKEAIFYNMKTPNRKEILINKSSLLQIRPHFGYGSSNSRHYGARILLNSSDIQAYGLEITDFKSDNNHFQAVGIVLEQRLWEWFNMSIGTVGYLNYGEKRENIIGLVSNLGFEPNNHIPFRPFITYRSDTIFAKEKTKLLHSVSVGFKFEF